MDKQRLEEITGEFCDRYCKFQYICKDEEQLETVCEDCPMNKLVELFD